MRRTITTFLLQEDSGAVTVDWVVMTAIVTALGALVTVLSLSLSAAQSPGFGIAKYTMSVGNPLAALASGAAYAALPRG